MSASAKLRVAGDAAKVIGHWLTERAKPGRDIGPDSIPSSTSALTNEWITHALCRENPGAAVVDFEVGPGSDGTSARRQLTVRYNEAGKQAGLPENLYTKSSPTLKSRLFCGLSAIAVNETEFYLKVRPELNIETPLCYHGVYGQTSGRSMLLLEDIAVTRGATFADPRLTTVDRANAERMVTIMAGYHGPLWEDPRLDREFWWLQRSEDFQRRLDDALGFRRMLHNGVKRSREFLSSELVLSESDVSLALDASLELRARSPQTLLHQDVHARNWYFTVEGHIGIYDWQANGKGLWAVDLGYALSANLTPENRRAWEGDLLALYLDQLAAKGGKAPSYDDAWLAYRQQMVHGLGFWLATIGRMALQPDLQPREVCEIVIERTAQAVVDLDSLRALRTLRPGQ